MEVFALVTCLSKCFGHACVEGERGRKASSIKIS